MIINKIIMITVVMMMIMMMIAVVIISLNEDLNVVLKSRVLYMYLVRTNCAVQMHVLVTLR
jgi:hypothetical protein